MARIRSIKPEFPHSESMGRVSRDARLAFLLMWTIADDSGRLRGNSRMLASLLFPYDDDAPALIDGWLDELDREHCIARYEVDGQRYVEIRNWLKHQKIDKPSASKLPEFVESSRILANPRERSSEEGKGREGKGSVSKDADASLAPVLDLVVVSDSTPRNPSPVSNGVTPPKARASAGKVAAIWAAYSPAYQDRYGVEPIQNAKVNGMLARFAERVPAEEAPLVAAWFLRSDHRLYVNAKHPIDLLLRDAEKLRTEWATATHGTETEARLADSTGQRRDVWGKLIQEAKDAKPAAA